MSVSTTVQVAIGDLLAHCTVEVVLDVPNTAILPPEITNFCSKVTAAVIEASNQARREHADGRSAVVKLEEGHVGPPTGSGVRMLVPLPRETSGGSQSSNVRYECVDPSTNGTIPVFAVENNSKRSRNDSMEPGEIRPQPKKTKANNGLPQQPPANNTQNQGGKKKGKSQGKRKAQNRRRQEQKEQQRLAGNPNEILIERPNQGYARDYDGGVYSHDQPRLPPPPSLPLALFPEAALPEPSYPQPPSHPPPPPALFPEAALPKMTYPQQPLQWPAPSALFTEAAPPSKVFSSALFPEAAPPSKVFYPQPPLRSPSPPPRAPSVGTSPERISFRLPPRPSTGFVPAPGHTPGSIITEEDLWSTPMESCHKELVVGHYRRLNKILHEADEAAIGTYTNKQAAREQLARMTLIIRDYMKSPSSDTIESMVADVVDASFSICGTQSSFHQPTFVNSTLWGREQEIAALMQELSAGDVDDVLELWNVVPEKSNKVVPDSSAVEDIGREVDWNGVLFRSRSEDNITHDRQDLTIENQELWEEDLVKRELEQLDLAWLPVFRDPEPNVGRQRRRTSEVASMGVPVVNRVRREEVLLEPCSDAETVGSSG
ncbi:hypothetical protein PRZ48_008438 [Zasmidium cellare]|uniref:Uncharacterized protein n=1 Tax=Zasmidium cellare TaxID=395010 RepID=A0ABR0EFU6_ZASCE|nr:hypothetical protein PRZ48_008438 [Zasmidium cellare]